MASVKLTRNVYNCGRKYVKNVVTIQGYNSTRSRAVVTDAETYAVPELATAKPFEDIPAIPSFPMIGSSWVYFPIFGKYNIDKLHKADKHKNEVYGDIIREKIGNFELVTIFDADGMEIITQHEGKYPHRSVLETMKAYRESRKHWYKNNGIMILQGKEWHDLRTRTQKYLNKPKTIQAYLYPMQDVAKDFVKIIYKKRNKSMEVDDLMGDLYKWALESVAFVGLDTRLGCLDSDIAAGSDGRKLIECVNTQFYCMKKLEAVVGNLQFRKYLPSPTLKKYTKASDTLTEIVFKYMNRSLENLKKRKEDAGELTMLQSMLLTSDLDVSKNLAMVADMLFAGIDTTSHTVGFLLYLLSKHPDKQQILADEIRQLLPNKGDRITPEVFIQLHYMKACLKESLRLYPVVRGVRRALDHDVVISGYRIPAGTTIFCNTQQMFRKEKYFKNANKFIPERWMNKDDKLINPYAYVPFGFGVRSCIGRRLAEMEIACVITEILRNFEMEYHYEDFGLETGLVTAPDKPLRFSFLDR